MESTQKINFDLPYVFEYFIAKKGGINKACKYIAKRLNNRWGYKHIYNVYRGATPSGELKQKLIELVKPSRKRHRIIIEAKSLKQFKAWQALNMDQRREALDDKVRG